MARALAAFKAEAFGKSIPANTAGKAAAPPLRFVKRVDHVLEASDGNGKSISVVRLFCFLESAVARIVEIRGRGKQRAIPVLVHVIADRANRDDLILSQHDDSAGLMLNKPRPTGVFWTSQTFGAKSGDRS